jgi:hypothetical protein
MKDENVLISAGIFVCIVVLAFVLVMLTSCTSITPISISDKPVFDATDDYNLTVEQYLYYSTKYKIDSEKYIDDLLIQIVSKVPYVDISIKQETERIKRLMKKDVKK